MLAALDAPSSRVYAHIVLTWFQTDALSIVADVTFVALAAAYLIGVARVARRGRRFPRSAIVAFLCGDAVLFFATCSGFAAYDDVSFAMHAVQHLLIMMVAAPLVALGRPMTLLAQATSGRTKRVVVRALNSRAAAVVTGPWCVPLYVGAMWVAFLSPLYALDLRDQLTHDAAHLGLFLVGYCYFAGVAGLEPSPAHASPLRRIAFLLLGGPPEAALGIVLLVRSRPLPRSTLALTHEGGGAFLVGSMLISGLALTAVLYDYARRDEDRVARAEAAAERGAVERGALPAP